MNEPLYRDTFANLGSFLQAVAASEMGDPANRLQFLAAAGANSTIPSEGGFLVPDQLAATIWDRAWTQGELLSRCARQPVTLGNGIKIPAFDERSRADGSRLGGMRMYWPNEADTVSPTKPKASVLELNPKKLLGILWGTGELVEDAAAWNAWVERAFSLEAVFTVEDLVVNGSGVGRPLGILNSDATIEVAAEGGQAAGSVVAANVRGMINRSWVGSRRASVWLCNPDIESDLESLETTAGAPLFSYGADGTPRLAGRPVIPTEYNAAQGSRGDLILADLGQYLIAERDQDLISSIHVAFLEFQQAFRFRWRLDGQPAWAGPVTPQQHPDAEPVRRAGGSRA